MAYQTGTATSPNDLLDKLRIFAQAQGWTVNRNTAVTNTLEVCISKGTSFFNFLSGENTTILVNGSNQNFKYGIVINGSDSYDGPSPTMRQPGYPQRSITPSVTDQYMAFVPFVTNFGPFPAYHFFTPNANSIHVEIEVMSSVFQRFGFGACDLFNPVTPGDGRYFYGTAGEHVTNATTSNTWLGEEVGSSFSEEEVPFRSAEWNFNLNRSASAVRVNSDCLNNWAGSGNNVSNTRLKAACQGGNCKDRIINQISPNPINGVAILTPITLSLNVANTYLRGIGTVPGIRYMDMTNFLPGEEFTLGSDVWKVFPWYQQNGRSYQQGIAHLKVI